MSQFPAKELTEALAREASVSAEDVSRVLVALANVAYEQARTGFVLPGFGEFRVVTGADTIGINPFTGKEVTFRGKQLLQFTADTAAKERFLASRKSPTRAPSIVAETQSDLPAVRLVPDHSDLLAADVKRASPEGPRCKLGGDPDWIQADDTPICCGQRMLFYGQLDSLDSHYRVGDMGMLYVFVCEMCCSSVAVLQF